MSDHSDWSALRDRRLAEPGSRDGYEAERRAYELGEAVRRLRRAGYEKPDSSAAQEEVVG